MAETQLAKAADTNDLPPALLFVDVNILKVDLNILKVDLCLKVDIRQRTIQIKFSRA